MSKNNKLNIFSVYRWCQKPNVAIKSVRRKRRCSRCKGWHEATPFETEDRVASPQFSLPAHREAQACGYRCQ